MTTYLNFHAHRMATAPDEEVIRSFCFPFSDTEQEAWSHTPLRSTGIHPWHIPENWEEALHDMACRITDDPQCVAIGEIGLDRCIATPMQIQNEVFAAQLRMASRLDRPAVIHCVRAWDELLAVYRSAKPQVPCVIHGFHGKPEQCRQLLRHGFWLSFGFHFHPDSLTACSSDRMFLESDEDLRTVSSLYSIAADLRGGRPEELAEQCRRNCSDLRITLPL